MIRITSEDGMQVCDVVQVSDRLCYRLPRQQIVKFVMASKKANGRQRMLWYVRIILTLEWLK